jgi:hypothetical protein
LLFQILNLYRYSEAARDWLAKQVAAAGGKYASAFDAEQLIPRLNGREMCTLPEPEFHRRVRVQMPGQMVGLYKLKSVINHSLTAPGFNPRTYEVRKTGFKVCFHIQLVPLHDGR